ncbi:MAG: O-antigen ligase family protein [Phenylobacterium sp.]|jgi:exopolysaccharide production protein ExoQ|uniref:O-antigen ligase family protein n=1 Tax=Phenylobacterium sp. TaxID=1871053 RepID=UPI00391CA800
MTEARLARAASAPFQLNPNHPLVLQALVTAVLALMSIQTLGAISTLLQILLVLLVAAIRWRELLANAPRLWPFAIFPLLAVASAVWSTAPEVSFRYGLQFAFTALAGLIAAASLGPNRFLGALYVANLIVVFGSLVSGRYGMSMEGPVMIGLTGSKNQMAFASQLALSAAVAVFFDRTQPAWMRWSAPIGAVTALGLLVQANSASGILTAIGAAAVFVGLMSIRGLKPGARLGVVLLGLAVATPAVVAKDAIVEQAQRISTTVFKKDPTLTGRTYLWMHADRLIAQRPAIGHGYRAIWLGNSTTTQGLLRWANLKSGHGFNFHNTYKEVTVDLGYVGLAVFVVTIGAIGLLSLAAFLREATIAAAFFFTTYLSLMARTFTELMIGPFGLATLLLFAFGGYAVLRWISVGRARG